MQSVSAGSVRLSTSAVVLVLYKSPKRKGFVTCVFTYVRHHTHTATHTSAENNDTITLSLLSCGTPYSETHFHSEQIYRPIRRAVEGFLPFHRRLVTLKPSLAIATGTRTPVGRISIHRSLSFAVVLGLVLWSVRCAGRVQYHFKFIQFIHVKQNGGA